MERRHRGRSGVMSFAVLGFSFPVFVVGYVLIYIFAIKLKLLPIQGYRPLADGFWPFLRHPSSCRASRSA